MGAWTPPPHSLKASVIYVTLLWVLQDKNNSSTLKRGKLSLSKSTPYLISLLLENTRKNNSRTTYLPTFTGCNSEWVDVHTWKLHHWFSFIQLFKAKFPLKWSYNEKRLSCLQSGVLKCKTFPMIQECSCHFKHWSNPSLKIGRNTVIPCANVIMLDGGII